MADKLRIMLVDDHYLVRMGLASIIALEPDMTVCAEASTGEQAQALFRTQRPDVTLMDLRLPGMNGADTTQAIRSEFPDARIVMISTYVCDEEIYGALQAGAMAYLVKSVQREELMRAIRKAAAGQRHIPAGGGGATGRPRLGVAAVGARDRGPPVSGQRPAEPRNRQRARDHRGHGQAPRQQHPGQARCDGSDRGRHQWPSSAGSSSWTCRSSRRYVFRHIRRTPLQLVDETTTRPPTLRAGPECNGFQTSAGRRIRRRHAGQTPEEESHGASHVRTRQASHRFCWIAVRAAADQPRARGHRVDDGHHPRHRPGLERRRPAGRDRHSHQHRHEGGADGRHRRPRPVPAERHLPRHLRPEGRARPGSRPTSRRRVALSPNDNARHRRAARGRPADRDGHRHRAGRK